MEKIKKLLILVLLSSLILTGCKNEEAEVRERLTGFLEDMKDFNLDGMGSMVKGGEEDAEFNLEDLENDQVSQAFMAYFKESSKKIDYKIGDIDLDKDKARVDVDFKYIDGENLFKYTLADLMEEAFSMALIDGDLADEKMSQAALEILEENKKNLEEEFMDRSLKLNLVKLDGQWFLEEIDEGILDVLTCNFNSVLNQLDDGIGDLEGGEGHGMEDKNIIKKEIGQELELKNLNITVTTVEETNELVGDLDEKTQAREGSKFLVIGLDIVNTSKEGFSFYNDFLLIDQEGREYQGYGDSIGNLKNYMDGRDLAPSIKEEGFICFELPEDSLAYSIFIGKEAKDEVYEVVLR